MLRSYLDGKTILIGHNTAVDFGVLCTEDETLLPLVFDAYRAGVVRDTMVRAALIDIREGRHIDGNNADLASLHLKYGGVEELDKGSGSWRYWYGSLLVLPIDKWPSEALEYAQSDARATLNVFDGQQTAVGASPSPDFPDTTISPDEVLQTRAAWCLHLMRMWGFRTDAPMVAALKTSLEHDVAEAEQVLLARGIYKYAKQTKKQKLSGEAPELKKDLSTIKARVEAAFKAQGKTVPTTPTGGLSVARATLLEANDPELTMYAKHAKKEKLLSTFIPLVETGTKVPIAPRWNTLVRSGRTSCGAEDDPGNWQNPIKEGGIRECVIPRPGNVLASIDYSQIELCGLAQTLLDWFGYSEMAKALQAGRDLHLDFACANLIPDRPSYEEGKARLKAGDKLVKEMRQRAKAANFGFPGGLGAKTFIAYALGYGVKISLTDAEGIKNAWLDRWVEMRPYFQRIALMADLGNPIVQPMSGRLRGRPEFCSTANTMFQGRAADGMKEAMWQIIWKCYNEPSSALFGTRVILLLHDELIYEMPVDKAHEACEVACTTMVKAMEKWTPNIPIKVNPALMLRWNKNAEEVRDSNGRLQVWEPKKEEAA